MHSFYIGICIIALLFLYVVYELTIQRRQVTDYSKKLHGDFEDHFQRQDDICSQCRFR